MHARLGPEAFALIDQHPSTTQSSVALFLGTATDLTTGLEHLTASAIVIDRDRDLVLLVFHPILNAWIQPGGHIRDDELPWDAATREVEEETGFRIAFGMNPRKSFLGVVTHIVGAYNGEPHTHHDLRFGVASESTKMPIVPGSEVRGVAWVRIDALSKINGHEGLVAAIASARSQLRGRD